MRVQIINDNNPYSLDRIAANEKLVALTRKNADFLQAVVKLDSNYAKDFQVDNDDSTIKLFKQIQEGKNFAEYISRIITEIDKTNSTHLEAAKNGREVMAKRVCEKCKNVDELVAELQKDFDAHNHNHILAILADKIDARKEGGVRYNLSFASKFCSYASEFLQIDKEYSKYDNVVAKALPEYSKIYLGKSENQGAFLIQQYHKGEDELQYRLDVYEKYCNCINAIIDVLKEDNIKISRDEFDHIIWYSSK